MNDMSSDADLGERADLDPILLRAKLFRGLADTSRLFILEALRAGPLSDGAIVEITGLSQSNASNHLRCLSECGLVSGVQRGRYVHYGLGDSRLEDLLVLASELLGDEANGVETCGNYVVSSPS